jgi:hypothetical protein
MRQAPLLCIFSVDSLPLGDPRTAQADLAELLPGAGIAAHILRALRMSKWICDSWNAQSISFFAS